MNMRAGLACAMMVLFFATGDAVYAEDNAGGNTMTQPYEVWGLTEDGAAGTVAQVKALSAALGVTPQMKQASIRRPFVNFLNMAYDGPMRHLLYPWLIAPGSDTLNPPWPKLVIACGRVAALVAMGLRAKTGDQTKYIYIQDPQVSPGNFDIVVPMEHDRLDGPNVISVRYALHAITPQKLEEAHRHFATRFASYPGPRVSVLIGGTTNRYFLTPEAMDQVVASLKAFQKTTGASLLITSSRRTREENTAKLREAFAGNDRVYVYDFKDENPYMGMLAWADAIIVTNDSVNMMSEAYATGKPIYILKFPGHEDTKLARFGDRMISEGVARPLGETLESWTYPQKDEMQMLVTEIKRRLALP